METPPPTPPLTAGMPGTGGRIKSVPEDFVVDEIPAYEPTGAGQHLFLLVEKTGVSADAMLEHIASTLEIDRREVGYAGMKDTQAITRQVISVPRACEARIRHLESAQLRILSTTPNAEKLRTGHLLGNRFNVLIRDPVPEGLQRAQEIVAALKSRGLPNYYGPQRFGQEGNNASAGFSLLRGERITQLNGISAGQRRFRQRLFVSAAQSALFNSVLVNRLHDVLLHTVLQGDVLHTHATGIDHRCLDPEHDQARLDAKKTVPAGPMFGPKMLQARKQAYERELAVLHNAGLSLEHFEALGRVAPGARRPMLLWPQFDEMASCNEGLRVRFELPPGAYATVLLSELMKPDNGA